MGIKEGMASQIFPRRWARPAPELFVVGAEVAKDVAKDQPHLTDYYLGIPIRCRHWMPKEEFYLIPIDCIEHLDALAGYLPHEHIVNLVRLLAQMGEEKK